MINLNPFKWGNAIAALIIVALTAAAILGIFWTVDGMVERAAKRVSEARDAHWTAQIEKSNAEAERQRAEQIQRASAESETARSEIDRLRASLTDMEKLNASLPGGNACGLDVRRVRALPR
jgi:hypothetical protein